MIGRASGRVRQSDPFMGVHISEKQVVLVTGASSGVGQSTAELLAQRGYQVFGTSRQPAGAAPHPE